jgi:hypothetical protein
MTAPQSLSPRRFAAYTTAVLLFCVVAYVAPDLLRPGNPPQCSEFMTISMEDRSYRIKRSLLWDVIPPHSSPRPKIPIKDDCRLTSATAATFVLSSVPDAPVHPLFISRRLALEPITGASMPLPPDLHGPPEKLSSGLLRFGAVYYSWPGGDSPMSGGLETNLDCSNKLFGRKCKAAYISADGEFISYAFYAAAHDPDDWPSLDTRVRRFVGSMRLEKN